MKFVRMFVMGGIALAAVACGAEGPGTSGTSPAPMEIDQVGDKSKAELPEALSEAEIAGLPTLAGESGPTRDQEAYASCWVTLNWCHQPGTGRATCTATSGCTAPAKICQDLIDQHCGNIGDNGVVCARTTGSWSCSSF